MKCYSAFLDARKAFDTVWHAGLFVKLYKAGLSGIATRWRYSFNPIKTKLLYTEE